MPDGSVPQFGSLLMICRQRLRHALPLEGAYAGQHFIDHDPECPHIGVPVDGATQSLFRRHVRSAAEDDADVRPVRAHGRRVHHVDRSGCVHVERLRQPEVEHLHYAVVADFDVRWFEVAMDDAAIVGGFECFRDLQGDCQRLLQRQRAAGDQRGEGRSVHQFENKAAHAASFHDAINAADVGMIDGGKELRFSIESREPVGVAAHEVWQHL